MDTHDDLDTEDEGGADGPPEDDLGDCCAHGMREDRDCMECHADGCPGGGSCGCPGNAPRSKRHLFRNNY